MMKCHFAADYSTETNPVEPQVCSRGGKWAIR
jgi:hypothetical protein